MKIVCLAIEGRIVFEFQVQLVVPKNKWNEILEIQKVTIKHI